MMPAMVDIWKVFSESGFPLMNDTRDLAIIESIKGTVLLAANNQDSLKAILVRSQSKLPDLANLADVDIK